MCLHRASLEGSLFPPWMGVRLEQLIPYWGWHGTKDTACSSGLPDAASCPERMFPLNSLDIPHQAALVTWLDHTGVLARIGKNTLIKASWCCSLLKVPSPTLPAEWEKLVILHQHLTRSLCFQVLLLSPCLSTWEPIHSLSVNFGELWECRLPPQLAVLHESHYVCDIHTSSVD